MDLRRGIDGLASIVKFNFQMLHMKNKFFSSSAVGAVTVSRGLYGKVMASSLQKAGAWRLQLALYKRRGTGDYTGTISGIVAGSGECI